PESAGGGVRQGYRGQRARRVDPHGRAEGPPVPRDRRLRLRHRAGPQPPGRTGRRSPRRSGGCAALSRRRARPSTDDMTGRVHSPGSRSMDAITRGTPVEPKGKTVLRTFDYRGVRLLPGLFLDQVEHARRLYGDLSNDDVLKG